MSYLLSVAMIHTITKANSGRKGFISADKLQAITEGNQGRDLEAGLKQRLQRDAAFTLAPNDLLHLPFNTTWDTSPGLALPTATSMTR